MAYSADLVTSKLAALNDSQEGITSVSQWILFHRRNAAQSVEIWFDSLLKASSSRKLSLIYVANDVVQQSRAKKRTEFVEAFSPVIVRAIENAYRHGNTDVHSRLRRVIQVWRQRQVFPESVIAAVEAKTQVQASGSSGSSNPTKATLLNKRAESSSNSVAQPAPQGLEELVSAQKTLLGAFTASATAYEAVTGAYDEVTKFQNNINNDPTQALRLFQLKEALSQASTSIDQAVSARKHVITRIERLLQLNKAALQKDEERRKELEDKFSRVDDIVMSINAPTEQSARSTTPDVPPPAVEELTPPPVREYEVLDSAYAGAVLSGPDSTGDLDGMTGHVPTLVVDDLEEYVP
ncbi:hypothetical protein YB2330_001380 [Saitoella coloradoensis]